MFDDIRDGEIVCKKKFDERSGGEENQDADGKTGVTRALDEKWIARANGENSANDGVGRAEQREQQRKGAKDVHSGDSRQVPRN